MHPSDNSISFELGELFFLNFETCIYIYPAAGRVRPRCGVDDIYGC